MVFNDTTNKSGIIQRIEFWTRMPDATISGSSFLLSQFTTGVNSAFDRIMPMLLSYTDYIRWDDTNHTDKPVGTIDLTSGSYVYKITEDDNSLDILNLTQVLILPSTTATDYVELERITADDKEAPFFITHNSGQTGRPTKYLESGNNIYFDYTPDYTKTGGIKLIFEREQSRFASSDTTKEPGIPKPFHELLALYPALDWNRVNRTDDPRLLNEIKEEIFKQERNLMKMIELRNPTRKKITLKKELYI